MGSAPPNLVIVTCDELRADACGFMGNPDCRTPHLDRLAGEGVVLGRHFAVHGKCVPSRIAMVTGRYPHTDGFRTIHQHLPPDHPNLLAFLKARGYETAVLGLNHMYATLFDSHVPRAAYADYHSFTDGPLHDLAHRRHPVRPPGPGAREPVVAPGAEIRTRRLDRDTGDFSDDARTAQALLYLREIRDRARPFFLHVNLSKPHPGYEVEEPYFSMYDRDAIRAWPHDLPRNAPLPLRAMREVRAGGALPEAVLRDVQAVYYGMVTKVESLVGRILDELRAQGLRDRSVVLFTSDHGDFAGQFGLFEKWDTCMADCLLRVPCLLCAPGLGAGVRFDGLSEHTDLVPTLLELLGLRPDWGVHGASLLPAIRGEAHAKPFVFADGGHEAEMWPRFNHAPRRRAAGADGSPPPLDGKQRTYRDHPESMARAKMARSDRWKLVVRLAGGHELYDLAADPWELHNLWDERGLRPDARAAAEQLQLAMAEWCLRTDTDRPYQKDVGA